MLKLLESFFCMANIANGFLSINLDKSSELNNNAVEEIINNLRIIIISRIAEIAKVSSMRKIK